MAEKVAIYGEAVSGEVVDPKKVTTTDKKDNQTNQEDDFLKSHVLVGTIPPSTNE